jgi:hypothetical protein
MVDGMSLPLGTTSQTYRLFEQAMEERKQVVCRYGGFVREVWPAVLGWKNGAEKALTFQFAGGSSSRLPPGGEWRCLVLANVTDVTLSDGPWRTGRSHQTSQVCVDDVDLDVNPDSPFNPRRTLSWQR